jgi:hypothetical protein
MLLNELFGLGELLRFQPVVRVEFDGRVNPELRFTVGVLDVHMRPPFLPREEVEAKASNAGTVGLTGPE